MNETWKKIINDYQHHGINIEFFQDKPQEIFYLKDVYLGFFGEKPLFLTRDLKLVDISNHNFSVAKFHWLEFYNYPAVRDRIKSMLANIHQGNYEIIQKKAMSLLAHQPFFPIHNMEDKINSLENYIHYIINDRNKEKNKDKETRQVLGDKLESESESELLHLLALETENIFYNDFLKEIRDVYHDFPFFLQTIDMKKIYKISELYINKLYHDFIWNTKSANIFIKYLNRKIKHNNVFRENVFVDRIKQSICVKMNNKFNGSNYDDRCLHFDIVHTDSQNSCSDVDYVKPNNIVQEFPQDKVENERKIFFKEAGFEFLNESPTYMKDFIVMNSDLVVLTYGSNMYVNLKLLNFYAGKKFIVLCCSGYNSETNPRYPIVKRTRNAFYSFVDDIFHGNFVRFVFEFNNRLNQISFSNIIADFNETFAYNQIFNNLKKIKNTYSFDFLDNLAEYKEYEKELRINIFWNKLGYQYIEIFNKLDFIDMNEFFTSLIQQNTTLNLESILSQNIHLTKLKELVKDKNYSVPINFWEKNIQ
jgi:hypothetical protein